MKKILFIVVIAIAAYSCTSRNKNTENSSIYDYSDCSEVPYCGVENIKLFVEAIKSDNMTIELANRLINPESHIVYDYPLRPIINGDNLMKYLPLLIDDELKEMLNSDGEKWVDEGWRGYRFNIGYIWFDDEGYLSWILPEADGIEKLDNCLIASEYATLHPAVKEKIQFPRLAFKINSNGWIGRIDRIESDVDFPNERDSTLCGFYNIEQLAIYKRGTPLTAKPDFILEGVSHVSRYDLENSFSFRTENVSIEVLNSTYDNPKGAKIYVKFGGGEASDYDYDKVVAAELVYWLVEFSQ